MLNINNVCFTFDEKTYVLNKLNASFDMGRIYSLSGKNGSGKTTLLKCINNDLNFQGSILLDGNKITLSDVALLSPETFFYNELTGHEFLALFKSKNSFEMNITDLSKHLELILDNPISTYSSGQKRKLSILCTLLLNRRVLLLDEPFNAIDKESVIILSSILRSYVTENKLIILTQHNDQILKDLGAIEFKL